MSWRASRKALPWLLFLIGSFGENSIPSELEQRSVAM